MNPNTFAPKLQTKQQTKSVSVRRLLEGRLRMTGGFSLIELMVVLAITGVMLAIATPSFREPLSRAQASGAANLLLSSIDTARSESMAKNTLVIVCRSADPLSTTPTCSNAASAFAPGSDWASGWLIYSKPVTETNPSAYSPATDTLIQRAVPSSSQSTGARTRLSPSPTIGLIAMGPQGTRVNAGGFEPVFTIEYRSDAEAVSPSSARCLKVNLLGRPELSSMSGASC
jgi:type IV fimbrial biogenesis protein FimT